MLEGKSCLPLFLDFRFRLRQKKALHVIRNILLLQSLFLYSCLRLCLSVSFLQDSRFP